MSKMIFEEFKNTLVAKMNEAQPVQLMGNIITAAPLNRSEGKHVIPCISVWKMYDLYLAGNDIDSIARNALNALNSADAHDINPDSLYDKEDMQIIACAVPKARLKMYDEPIYDEFLDLAIIYRRMVQATDNMLGSAVITKKYLDTLGITKEEMLKKVDNAVETCTLYDVIGYLGEGRDGYNTDILTLDDGPVVVKRKGDIAAHWMGAGAAFLSGIIPKIAEKNNCDVIILPSSIHELLLMPDYGDDDYEARAEMVARINETEVLPEDQLSDHVYGWSRAEGRYVIRA